MIIAILVVATIVGPVVTWFLMQNPKTDPKTQQQEKQSTPIPVKAENLDNASEIEKLRTAFYTNITHEFRTPLTVINGMADMIMEDPANAAEATNMIKRNSAGLLTLVNQMLDLSKFDSGAMSLNMIRGDVTTYLNYIIESLGSFAQQKGVSLEAQHEITPFNMDYDGEKLMQVVSNLISNGVKFTAKGGRVDVWTHTTNVGGNEQFHISVRDTGIGIGTEHLEHIFSRFYRVEDTIIKTSKGTGIGLALSKDLVELMQGQISVQSATGKGATFVVTLPVTREAPEDIYEVSPVDVRSVSAAYLTGDTPQSTSEQTAIIDPEVPLALIIEDNADVARFIGKCLQKRYRLDYASNGQLGIDKALEIVPDIVISDVMMPEKDGFDVCAVLKRDERTSHIPIVLLTARADMASKIEGLETGADAYMSKPFNQGELLVRVRKLLELRQLLQQRYTSGEIIDSSTEGPIIEDAFILKLNEVITEHISDGEFGSAHLSRAMTLSRSQLHNKIKALTGRSTALYVRYIRLLEARKRLKDLSFNISEIAYDLGFNDPAYFTRCFKDEFGTSPSEARAQYSQS